MGASQMVSTIPAQLVRAPAGFGLYFRIAVTTTAATLPSLLPGGVLPTIYVQNINGPAGLKYTFKYVDLQSETALATAGVRITADGQTVPTATLGFLVPDGAQIMRIPADAQDIKLISTSGTNNVQVYLGIMGTTTGVTN